MFQELLNKLNIYQSKLYVMLENQGSVNSPEYIETKSNLNHTVFAIEDILLKNIQS